MSVVADRGAPSGAPETDVIVIGAGFAGLYAVHKLREAGRAVIGIERAPGVGGVWYWNRYPGARCDIPSLEYSYSFSEDLQQEWVWKEKFASQPEILAYLDHVADRFNLREAFRFSVAVTRADYDSAAARWAVTLDDGSLLISKYLVLATGSLSTPKPLDFPGLKDFEGEVLHTSHWPTGDVDLVGRRVAVVGTGSSGLQTITAISKDVGRLYVLQRTPPYSVPAWNRPTTAEEDRLHKKNYQTHRERARNTNSGFDVEEPSSSALDASPEERLAHFEKCWLAGGLPFNLAYADILSSTRANALAADFVRSKIASIVRDPAVADRLTPTTYPIGSKRMCVDTGYYETFNRDNVELVDIANDALSFTREGFRAGDREVPVDTVIMATGFDALTGSILRIDISADGTRLADAWADGPKTMLGLMTAGFPNLFTITGPASPSVLSNMVLSIEQHVGWIGDTIDYLEKRHAVSIESTQNAQETWMQHVAELADGTVFPQAESWYMGSNIPGKPKMFMVYLGGVKAYADRCAEIISAGYPGFTIQTAHRATEQREMRIGGPA